MSLFGKSTPPQAEEPPPTLRRAVVTGVGPVSSVGIGRNNFYQALLEGRTGFGPITLCDASRSPSRIAAEVKDFHMDAFVSKGRIIERWAPRPVQLALAAAVLALHDAALDIGSVDPDRLALIVGTGIGNCGHVAEQARLFESGGNLAPVSPFLSIMHAVSCVLTSFFDLRGTATTVSTGCNSGVDALGQGLRMIQSGAAEAVLVVGVDCEVVPIILAMLNASGSLATRYNDTPELASRPWDTERDGNVIGEGAGAILLESEEAARRRGARLYARVAGYHMACAGGGRRYSHDDPDLEHATSARALRGALADASWAADEVDLVNANGSASVLYDALEARALSEVLGQQGPPVHSIKSMLGQHGAASSIFQCISACLALRRSLAPPTVNHDQLDPACAGLNVLTRPLAQAFDRVLVHSIGLGGFYYSSAAFEHGGWDDNVTGQGLVAWSEAHHPKHIPAPEFQRPLEPWDGAADFS